MTFKARKTKPEKGNKYYNTKGNGGYSDAIKGKPTDADCDVLSNCVGYAYGRFNEIGDYGYCKYLKPVNAENFIQYKGDLKTGDVPEVGACMVWRKGATLSGSDGAGHVAIVEEVQNGKQVLTSESNYGAEAFVSRIRNNSNGRWGMGSDYTFLGFIYNPAVSGSEADKNKTPLKYSVGDIVDFDGNTHYKSSYATSGTTCKPGVAKITLTANGEAHPYHLVFVKDGGSNVYGWVNEKDIAGIHNENKKSPGTSDGFTNSSLVSYTRYSPNHSGQRTEPITRITPHCVVGQLSVESLGNVVCNPNRQASCNYGIGKDGRVALYVDEKNRSWCSSSEHNDQRAITIECASDLTEPFAFNDTVYNRLIDLCVDICKRYGKKKLLWLGGKGSTQADKNACENYKVASDEMILTAHRFYANKSCPGDWAYSRFGDIAAKVTARLGGETVKDDGNKSEISSEISVGSVVKISENAVYFNGKPVPNWVKETKWVVAEVSGERVVINKSEDGTRSIMSPINKKYLTVCSPSVDSVTPYKVQVTVSALNIRKGAGTNYPVVGQIKDKGIYTIVAEAYGSGATKWLKLKSGVGYIASDYTKKI